MPVFQYVTKLFTVTWSTVREMVLNGQSFTEVLRVNRRRAIFSIVVMGSFIFSVISLGADVRFVSILISYVKLQRQVQEREAQYQKEHIEHQTIEEASGLQTPDARQPAHIDIPDSAATPDPVNNLRSALTDWTPEN